MPHQGQNFWADSKAEPKRAYRWLLLMGQDTVPSYICKKVSKPSFTVSETVHKFINHSFYYPGRVEWNTIAITLADPVNPDAAATVIDWLALSGYHYPGVDLITTTLTKDFSTDSIGQIRIQQLGTSPSARTMPKDGALVDHQSGDPGRAEIIEEWVLVNPWIKDAKFGDLDYESDDIMNIELEIRYDWAYISNNGDALSRSWPRISGAPGA